MGDAFHIGFAFDPDSGRLVELFIEGDEHLDRLRLKPEETASYVVGSRVAAARKRLMAWTHGLYDPSDEVEP